MRRRRYLFFFLIGLAIGAMARFSVAEADTSVKSSSQATANMAAGAGKEGPPFALTDAERVWLENHPDIRFAPAPNYPPVEFFDENGEYRGITADFIQRIHETFGIRFEILRFEKWSDVVSATRQGNVDMWGAAAKTKDREKYMRFTEPYIRLPAVIIVHNNVSGPLTMADLKGKQVAVIENYATHAYIEENYPFLDLVEVPDIETGLRDVAFRRVDSIVATNASAIYYIEKDGFTNLRVAGESGYEWHLRFAVRADWPELATILQKCLDSIPEDEKKRIYRRWISLEGPSRQMSKGQIIAILCVMIGLGIVGILIWNVMLQKKVEVRTKQLQSTLKEQSLILKNAQIGIAYIKNGKVHWINPTLAFQSDMDEKHLIGESTRVFFLTDTDYHRVNDAMAETLETGDPYEIDILLKRGRRGRYWCRLICQSIDPDHVQEGSIWLMDDITAQKELEEYLTKLAATDHLTGAYNRRQFMDLAEREITRSKRSRHFLAILMLDIDHFKQLNDAYGHSTGDEALKFFVDTVESILRGEDILGRIGGEEFAVLLPNTDIEAGKHVAERIRHQVASNAFISNGETIRFTVSIGLTDDKNGETPLEELLALADKALYKAKNNGRNRVEGYARNV